MYSIFFYFSLWIKVRQSFLCLIIRSNTMLKRSKPSFGWSNVDCLLWGFAILWHWSTIATLFQCSFIEFFAAKIVLVSLLQYVLLQRHNVSAHLSSSLKRPGSLLSCFLWTLQQVLGKKLLVAFALKLTVQYLERNWSPLACSSGTITSSKFSPDKAKLRESVSFQILHFCQCHRIFWRNCSKVSTFSVLRIVR